VRKNHKTVEEQVQIVWKNQIETMQCILRDIAGLKIKCGAIK